MTLPPPLIIFLASYLNWVLFLTFAYLWLKRKRKLFWRSVLAVVVAWGIATSIQLTLYSPRPYVTMGTPPLLATHFPLYNSFPSGHAAATAALAFTVLPEIPVLGVVLLGGSFLVDLGRVLALAHYWQDILGGTALAFITSWVIRKLPRLIVVR